MSIFPPSKFGNGLSLPPETKDFGALLIELQSECVTTTEAMGPRLAALMAEYGVVCAALTQACTPSVSEDNAWSVYRGRDVNNTRESWAV